MPNFGDEVKVTLEPRGQHTLLVVGVMAYSDNGEIVLVANPDCIGMPINKQWLEPTGDGNSDLASEMRARYLAEFPNTLKD